MTKADLVRRLAQKGLSVSDVSRQVGVTYQHAYNVMRNAGLNTKLRLAEPLDADSVAVASPTLRPSLAIERLTVSGFNKHGAWMLSDGKITPSEIVPKERGVYAFVKGNIVVYLGLATTSLSRRLYYYTNPGPSQRTNQRVNELIRDELFRKNDIIIYTASPPQLEWNGLPIAADVGLELGLIQTFNIPWNIRGNSRG